MTIFYIAHTILGHGSASWAGIFMGALLRWYYVSIGHDKTLKQSKDDYLPYFDDTPTPGQERYIIIHICKTLHKHCHNDVIDQLSTSA